VVKGQGKEQGMGNSRVRAEAASKLEAGSVLELGAKAGPRAGVEAELGGGGGSL
jgi:hypothetical protein